MGRRKKVVGDAVEGSKTEYNFWDPAHDGPFLDCLLELTEKGQISNGIAKNGVFCELQRMMERKVPGCGLKAKPTIQNRYKKLKHWYHSTILMRNQSGFGWDEEKCCVDADKPVWDVFVAQNPTCKSFNRLPFPQFEDLAPVFANGRATSAGGISGNDPEIIPSGGDSSDDDEEDHPICLDDLDTPSAEDAMFKIINEGLGEKNKNKKKRPAKNVVEGSAEKKKKVQASQPYDQMAELTTEMKHIRPLIKQSVDTIAKALGESEEYDAMRRDLMSNLEKLEGLNIVQKVKGFRRLNSTLSDLKCFYELDDGNRVTLVLDLLGP